MEGERGLGNPTLEVGTTLPGTLLSGRGENRGAGEHIRGCPAGGAAGGGGAGAGSRAGGVRAQSGSPPTSAASAAAAVGLGSEFPSVRNRRCRRRDAAGEPGRGGSAQEPGPAHRAAALPAQPARAPRGRSGPRRAHGSRPR